MSKLKSENIDSLDNIYIEDMIITDANFNILYLGNMYMKECDLYKNIYDIFRELKDEEFALKLIEVSKSSTEKRLNMSEYFSIDYGTNDKEHFLLNINPILENNKVMRVMFKITNVTKLYEEKENAEKAVQEKASFLARTSHEIRTPMNAILGMSELILREHTNEHVKEYAHSIKSATSNLLSIINDILDISKVESGKMAIGEYEYEFASIINDIINMINTRLEDEEIKLIVEIDSDIPHIMYGDETRIRQIILNLVNNAVKFTEKGYVKLVAKLLDKQDEEVYIGISVEDTGIGIKKDDLAKIFESFNRVDEEKNRNIEGTGLGLSICKSLINMMDGDIYVESEYGRGSTFKFELKQKISNYKKCAELLETQENKKIIVYESDEDYRKSIENTMINLGIKAEFESNIDSFENKLYKKYYDYAFIQYNILDRIKMCSDFFNKNLSLIIMMENKQTYNLSSDIIVVSKPLYSLPIVSIINETKIQSIYDRDRVSDDEKFIAPEADVLIVDDNEVNLRVAAGLMKEYKFNIDTSINGYDAIEKVKVKRYDIIFMDYMMPGLDGIETTREIRHLDKKESAEIPIIALTANAIIGAKDMFLKNGMDDFISKPIELKKLNSVLNKWIPKNLKSKFTEDMKEEERNKKITHIYGVDFERSMELNKFTEDLYIDLLKTFFKDGMNKVKTLNENIETNIERYIIDIHGVKSAAASIGAYQLSNKAKMLEMAGKEGKADYIYENNDMFICEYERILRGIKEIIEPKSEMKVLEYISEDEYKSILAEVKFYLENFDSDNAIVKLELISNKNTTNDLNKNINLILDNIEMFEYEKAIELIDEII